MTCSSSSRAIYVQIKTFRHYAATAGTELARASVGTIRLKLLKIGAEVLRNTRRVQLLLSSAHPHQDLFFTAAARLTPG